MNRGAGGPDDRRAPQPQPQPQQGRKMFGTGIEV